MSELLEDVINYRDSTFDKIKAKEPFFIRRGILESVLADVENLKLTVRISSAHYNDEIDERMYRVDIL
jgi:hypothetical protein